MQRKCYIIVVTQALVVCLICPPSALGPAALGLRVYISGRPLVPVLQMLHSIFYGEYYTIYAGAFSASNWFKIPRKIHHLLTLRGLPWNMLKRTCNRL